MGEDDGEESDDDEAFEDALDIARRTRREMMRHRARLIDDHSYMEEEEEEESFDRATTSSSEEEEEKDKRRIDCVDDGRRRRGRKLKSWAGAYSTFEDPNAEAKPAPFPLPRAFAEPAFLREERRVDFEEEEEDDERLWSHEKAETNSRNRRTAVAMTPMSTARNKSPFSSSSSKAASTVLVESLASQLRACELKTADALADAERESAQAARCERENEKLREKLKRMEESVKEFQRVCALDRRKNGRRRARGGGESEGGEDEIRRARSDLFVEGKGERGRRVCKDGERGGQEKERG